jgi:hypothetical protein
VSPAAGPFGVAASETLTIGFPVAIAIPKFGSISVQRVAILARTLVIDSDTKSVLFTLPTPILKTIALSYGIDIAPVVATVVTPVTVVSIAPVTVVSIAPVSSAVIWITVISIVRVCILKASA